MTKFRRQIAGMTVTEVLVVMIVVAILAAFAIPSYREYTVRTQRTEAKTALLQIATNQARFYLQNNTYSNDLAELGFPGGQSEKGLYTLAVPLANVNTFQVTAVPTVGGGVTGVDMNQDLECIFFGVTAQGARTAAPDPNSKCW